MPTYEYRCERGHIFELFQKMSDDPADTCAECGAAAERVVSGGAGFLFKGEGFYITDYRSEEYKSKAAAENPGDAATSKETPKDAGAGKGEGAAKKEAVGKPNAKKDTGSTKSEGSP